MALKIVRLDKVGTSPDPIFNGSAQWSMEMNCTYQNQDANKWINEDRVVTLSKASIPIYSYKIEELISSANDNSSKLTLTKIRSLFSPRSVGNNGAIAVYRKCEIVSQWLLHSAGLLTHFSYKTHSSTNHLHQVANIDFTVADCRYVNIFYWNFRSKLEKGANS